MSDPYFPEFGDDRFDVHHYDLRLRYRTDRNHLAGQARLRVVARTDLTELELDLNGLDVSKVALDTGPVSRFSHRRGRLRIRPRRPVPAGTEFVLTVGYSGKPQPIPDGDDVVGWEELDDGVLVAGQTNGASSWFPCNDRPDNKAGFRIEVTTASAYTVVANGTLVRRQQGAGTITWVYDQPEPMAPYLATVQIGRYVTREVAESPVPMTATLPPARLGSYDEAFGRQAEMMEFFSRAFGPYPFASYGVVITEDELTIPLEAQTLSVFGSNFLTDDWESVRLVAHELAHQWFGNSLTVASWQDIWLHEGFACYAEWLWSEESGGPSADDRAREHWDRLAELPQDLLLGDPGPDDMFDDRVYKRGALLLHALRCTVGEEDFFALLHTWTDRYRHGTVDTAAFRALAEEVTDWDLGAFFDAWLESRELPELP